MIEEGRDITINDLIDRVKIYNNNKEDIDLLNKAYDYAYKKHFGVKRISGDDYIIHLLTLLLHCQIN